MELYVLMFVGVFVFGVLFFVCYVMEVFKLEFGGYFMGVVCVGVFVVVFWGLVGFFVGVVIVV